MVAGCVDRVKIWLCGCLTPSYMTQAHEGWLLSMISVWYLLLPNVSNTFMLYDSLLLLLMMFMTNLVMLLVSFELMAFTSAN